MGGLFLQWWVKGMRLALEGRTMKMCWQLLQYHKLDTVYTSQLSIAANRMELGRMKALIVRANNLAFFMMEVKDKQRNLVTVLTSTIKKPNCALDNTQCVPLQVTLPISELRHYKDVNSTLKGIQMPF